MGQLNYISSLPNKIGMMIMTLVHYVNTIFYILLTIGFLCKRKFPKFRT
jgi:hypothetical protein